MKKSCVVAASDLSAASVDGKTTTLTWRGRNSARKSSAAARLRRGLRVLKLAAVASVLTVGVGAFTSSAQAGSIYPPNGYAFAMSCGSGGVSRRLPVVLADSSGVAWEITEVLQFDLAAREFKHYSWTDYRFQSIQAGQSGSPVWQEYKSGQPVQYDRISVSPGSYYALRHWVYVDNNWVTQVSDYCFA